MNASTRAYLSHLRTTLALERDLFEAAQVGCYIGSDFLGFPCWAPERTRARCLSWYGDMLATLHDRIFTRHLHSRLTGEGITS